MAWTNYTNFSLVVEKNGVEIERGNYSGFAVTENIVQWVSNNIVSSGTYLGDIGVAYGTASTAFNPWEFYSLALANTSTILKSEGLREILTSVGDILTIYNKNVGSRYALHMRRETDSGSLKRLTLGWTFAGATTWGNTVTFDGIDANNQSRGFVMGVLRDGYGAYPFYLLSVEPVLSGHKSANFYPWNGFRKTDFRSTYQYNYFFVFSDEWQPPTPPTPSTDPYADGGYSTGTDTGTGTFDDTSESVPLPTSYAMSATASGLISQYVLTEANLAAFGNWLWNGGSIIDDLKHFFASPMEAILSVGMLPFTPADTTQYTIYVASLNTNVTGGLVGDTVEEIDCGTIDFDGYYGSALDFNPYTKIEIFLPYCGNFALNPDEVMGHTIGVKYYCDTVSGDCVAFIYDEDRVLYQVKGNCFVQIPLAARDFTAQYASAIGTVGTVAAGLAASVASGGLTAPIAVGMGTSVAANAMNAKAHVARAGGVSGMAGFMSIQTPYVIITVPNQCLPELQADHQGYPLFVTKRLGDFNGFTKVYEIHLDGLDCTDAEAKEIYDLLKGGVIL